MKRLDANVEEAMTDAVEFVSNQALKTVEKYANNYSFSDNGDLMCLRDDLDNFIEINFDIEKCKSINAIQKVLLKYYTKKEIKQAIGQ